MPCAATYTAKFTQQQQYGAAMLFTARVDDILQGAEDEHPVWFVREALKADRHLRCRLLTIGFCLALDRAAFAGSGYVVEAELTKQSKPGDMGHTNRRGGGHIPRSRHTSSHSHQPQQP